MFSIMCLTRAKLTTPVAGHPKNFLFQETLAHPVLVHSFLTVAYKVCRNDEYRCLFHENMTLGYIGKGIQMLNTLSASDREASACALTWSIIRLATVKVIQHSIALADCANDAWLQINEGQLETSINHLNALALISPDMTVWDNHTFGQHFQTTTARYPPLHLALQTPFTDSLFEACC